MSANAMRKGWQDWKLPLVFAAIKLLLHFLTNTNYGFHRDEFLYLAIGERLSWGYMEVPPVIAVFGKLALSLGGQLFVVRLFPALIGGITVFLLGVMVKELGGKKWVQSFAWLAGLLALLLSAKLSAYRILGLIYLFIILIFIVLKGKGYYALGAYPMLMAAGGIAIESFLENRSAILKPVLVFLLTVFTIPLLPYGLPVLSIQNMQRYWGWMKDNLNFVGPLRWEDGKNHSLPQDYADMHGWEELAAKVGKLYHGLSPAEQQSCMIYGGGYAHASSINYYRKKYCLPEVCSFNGSFLMWAPDSVNFDRQIMALVPPETIAINADEEQWADRAAIFSGAQQFVQSGAKLVRLEFPRTEIQAYGDIAIIYTAYLFEIESDGQRQTFSGRGTEIFVRHGDSWVNPGWHLDSGK